MESVNVFRNNRGSNKRRGRELRGNKKKGKGKKRRGEKSQKLRRKRTGKSGLQRERGIRRNEINIDELLEFIILSLKYE